MTAIVSKWSNRPLGEVSRVFAGSGAPQGIENFSTEGPFFVRVSDLSKFGRTLALSSAESRLSQKALDSCSLVKARKGTVIFPRSGAAIFTNNRAILATEAFIVAHLMAIEPSDTVTSEWIYWWLCQIDLSKYSNNEAYPSLKQSDVEQILIPVPSLSEQKRVAAILNEQMAVVEKARAAAEVQRKGTQELTVSILRSVLDSADAQGWPRKSIAEFAETTSGATPSRGNAAYFGGTVPWIKTGELRDNLIESAEERVTELALAECSLPLLPEGTLLIAMYGQGQTRGRTGLLSMPATINQACFAILPDPSVFESRFLQYWFRHNYQRLRRETEGRGGNQPNLNGILLRNLGAPLPPVSDQRQIADTLDREFAAAERISEVVEQNVSTVDALPAVLLRRAFSGEL